MTENRNRAEEAFSRLFGEDASEEQRLRIMEVRRALGLPRNDAMWCILVALGFHLQLYEKIPAKIVEALESSADTASERVQILTEEAKAEAMEGLVEAVKAVLPRVSAVVAERQKLKWRTRSRVSLAILLGVLAVTMGGVALVLYDQGFNAGARADRNVVEWATSPSGINARALDGRGLLHSITREEINWMASREGRRGYELARDGTIGKLEQKGIEWLLSENIEWARKLDEAGHLRSDSLEKLNWLASREGRKLYQLSITGAFLDLEPKDVIWLVGGKGVLSRRLDELGLLRDDSLAKLQWLDTMDGRNIYSFSQETNSGQWRGFIEAVRSCSNRAGGLQGLLGG